MEIFQGHTILGCQCGKSYHSQPYSSVAVSELRLLPRSVGEGDVGTRRKAFVVYVNLDDTPGVMHSQESAQNVIRKILQDRIPQYNPIVSLAPGDLQPVIEHQSTE